MQYNNVQISLVSSCYQMTMLFSRHRLACLPRELFWRDSRTPGPGALTGEIRHFQILSLSRNQFTTSFHSRVISTGGRCCAESWILPTHLLTLKYEADNNFSRWLNIANSNKSKSSTIAYGSVQNTEADSYFSWSSSVMLLTNKTADVDTKLVHLSVTLTNFPKNDPGANLVYYKLSLSNNIAFNPYQQWVRMGSPEKLTRKQVKNFIKLKIRSDPSLHIQCTVLSPDLRIWHVRKLNSFRLVWLGYQQYYTLEIWYAR